MTTIVIHVFIFRRCIRSHSNQQIASFNKSTANFSKETSPKETADENNEPIKYFGSPAAKWTAKQSHQNPGYGTRLWYEPFVITASLTTFMIYFFILREENSIDEQLSMSLYDRIEGLEKMQLEASLKYNRDHGLSTLDLEKRLKELEEIELKSTAN